MTYIEFISENNIPVSPKEFAIVMGAITSGICMLFKNSNYSPLKKASFPEPIDTTIGKLCFSTKKDRNFKIRSLFTEEITIVPCNFLLEWFISKFELEKNLVSAT